MFDFLITERRRKCRFGKESPTPKAAIVTILRTPYSFMTATILACESAIKRGGATGAANGLPLLRGALSVTTTAVGGFLLGALNTPPMSDLDKGVPIDISQLILDSVIRTYF